MEEELVRLIADLGPDSIGLVYAYFAVKVFEITACVGMFIWAVNKTINFFKTLDS